MQITTTNRSKKNIAWSIMQNKGVDAEMETTINGIHVWVIVRGASIEITTTDSEEERCDKEDKLAE